MDETPMEEGNQSFLLDLSAEMLPECFTTSDFNSLEDFKDRKPQEKSRS